MKEGSHVAQVLAPCGSPKANPQNTVLQLQAWPNPNTDTTHLLPFRPNISQHEV